MSYGYAIHALVDYLRSSFASRDVPADVVHGPAETVVYQQTDRHRVIVTETDDDWGAPYKTQSNPRPIASCQCGIEIRILARSSSVGAGWRAHANSLRAMVHEVVRGLKSARQACGAIVELGRGRYEYPDDGAAPGGVYVLEATFGEGVVDEAYSEASVDTINTSSDLEFGIFEGGGTHTACETP